MLANANGHINLSLFKRVINKSAISDSAGINCVLVCINIETGELYIEVTFWVKKAF